MGLPNRTIDLHSYGFNFHIPAQFSLLMFGIQEVSHIGQKSHARNLGVSKQNLYIKTTGRSHHVMPAGEY